MKIHNQDAAVFFGPPDAPLPDWRAGIAGDVDPDDEELDFTPADVVAVLGFDPKEFSEVGEKAFCPTGPGGGVDNSCSPNQGDYKIPHRPRSDGPPAYDLLSGDLVPADVYAKPEMYVGDPRAASLLETARVLRRIRGKPNEIVTIYRAAPIDQLNTGDWVTLSQSYARQQGMADSEDADVLVHSYKVRAKDLIWAMDDLNEFGYYPSTDA